MLSSTNKTSLFPHEKERVVNKTCYSKPLYVVQKKKKKKSGLLLHHHAF